MLNHIIFNIYTQSYTLILSPTMYFEILTFTFKKISEKYGAANGREVEEFNDRMSLEPGISWTNVFRGSERSGDKHLSASHSTYLPNLLLIFCGQVDINEM